MPEFIPPELWTSNLPDLNKRTSADRVEAAGPHHHHSSSDFAVV